MNSKIYFYLISLFLTGAGLLFLGLYQANQTSPNVLGEVDSVDLVAVKRVVDGDTIIVLVAGQERTVRLVGINTPETVDPRKGVECFGKEASNETKEILKSRKVRLVKDISETDKFKRLLRFVYVPLDDGNLLFLNDYLVRMGFATASTYPPDVSFASRFEEAQAQAIAQNRGLWASCPRSQIASGSATIISP